MRSFSSFELCENTTQSCHDHGTCTPTTTGGGPETEHRCVCLYHYEEATDCERSHSIIWNGAELAYILVRLLLRRPYWRDTSKEKTKKRERGTVFGVAVVVSSTHSSPILWLVEAISYPSNNSLLTSYCLRGFPSSCPFLSPPCFTPDAFASPPDA